MRILTLTLCALILCFSARAQQLIEASFIQSLSEAQIETRLGADVMNGVDQYKVIYTVTLPNGTLDTASGLITVPDTGDSSALVIYNHGTSNDKNDVPSRLNSGFQESLAFGGMGFIVGAPDYIGMGDSKYNFHPYVQASTEAAAGRDLIEAIKAYAGDSIPMRSELFVSGYSQGGHASMALHQELELNANVPVTAAAHCSGPYDMSGTMLDVILSNEPYIAGGAYLPYVILGYQEFYGNLYTDLNEVFKAPYVPHVQAFYNGTKTLQQMATDINLALFFSTGNTVPKNILQDSVVDVLQSQPNHPIRQALVDNDMSNWTTQTPTMLYYCTADEQVSYLNSTVTEAEMTAAGSTNTMAINLNPNADHGACAREAIPAAVDFFIEHLDFSSTSNISQLGQIKVYPTVSSDVVYIESEKEIQSVLLTDMNGKMLQQHKGSVQTINLADYQSGVYILQITVDNQRYVTKVIRE